ncbi:MAG: hypothetical protein IPN53_18565 [Comamonadaceae bacterium]|nr:hypothetical protein [Comamonadaceae bacterium]
MFDGVRYDNEKDAMKILSSIVSRMVLLVSLPLLAATSDVMSSQAGQLQQTMAFFKLAPRR